MINSVQPYRVVFKGVLGTSFTSDMAIDDVSYTPACYQGGKLIDHKMIYIKQHFWHQYMYHVHYV